MQREVRIPRLSQQGFGPSADVIRGVRVAIGLAEDQIILPIAGSKNDLVPGLFQPMRCKNLKVKVVQADSAWLAGLRGLDSNPARVCSNLSETVIRPVWKSRSVHVSA